MQCSCPECGILLGKAERGVQSACVCFECGYACDICLGTNSVLPKEAIKSLEPLLVPRMDPLKTNPTKNEL